MASWATWTVAEVDGKIVGIGKLTLLYDGSAWLETLRVDPAYQGNGVGKAIYRRYLEEAAELNAPALRMYTGVKNAVSAGLAGGMVSPSTAPAGR